MASFTFVQLPLADVMALQSKAESFRYLVSETLQRKISQLQIVPLGGSVAARRGRGGRPATMARPQERVMGLKRTWNTHTEAEQKVRDLTSILNKASDSTKEKFSLELKAQMATYLENNDALIVRKFVSQVMTNAVAASKTSAFSFNNSAFASANKMVLLFAYLLRELDDQLVVSTVRQVLFENLATAESGATSTKTKGSVRGALMIFTAHLFNVGMIAATDVKIILNTVVSTLVELAKEPQETGDASFSNNCYFLMAILKILKKTPDMLKHVRAFYPQIQGVVKGFRTDKKTWCGADNRGVFQLEDIIAGKY